VGARPEQEFPMRLKTRVVKGLLLAVFVGSLLWVVVSLSALGNIYLSHSIPYSFNEWIVYVQIGGECWPGREPHSTLFYLVRFYALTAVIICAGVLSALYLKRLGQTGNRRAGAPETEP